MSQTKTLREREKELQALLGSPEGRKKLQDLESNCSAKSGKSRPPKASVVTYILVHERQRGLIGG